MRLPFSLLAVVLLTLRAMGEGNVPADSLFDAELVKVLVQQSQRGAALMPTLTLSTQYARRTSTDDRTTYQRGPYELAEQVFRSAYSYQVAFNTTDAPSPAARAGAAQAAVLPSPAVRTVTVAPAPVSWYVGAMVVHGETVGESPAAKSLGADYLVRVAVVPTAYANDTLSLIVLLQRARIDGSAAGIAPANAVYRRPVTMHAGDPLILRLPPIDATDATAEEVTITHEIPAGFGLAQNTPDPVSTRTMLAYALPSRCNVRLSVSSIDGMIVDTISSGVQEAGVYRATWDGTGRPDGHYAVSFEAVPVTTGIPFVKQGGFVKQAAAAAPEIPSAPDSVIERFPVTVIPLEAQRTDRVFRLCIEGGAAYLDPRKASSPFDNMFSHVSLGIGLALTDRVETGIVFGQDGFHRLRTIANPIIVEGDDAIETRIVTWVGGYGRYTFTLGGTRGFAYGSVASASGGAVTTLGVGMSVMFSSGISLFMMPHRTDQWDVHPSTKWGLNYGLVFQF